MRDLKLYIIIASAFFVIYLVALYNRPTPVNWQHTLSKRDKIPFGTYVLYNRLGDIFPNSIIRSKRYSPYTTLTETLPLPGNYIIIAHRVKVDESDFKKLKSYMDKGNNVFIAAFSLSTFFRDSLKLKISTEEMFNNPSEIVLSFVNPKFVPHKKYTFDKGMGNQYFSKFDTSKAVVLGLNSRGHATFIKYNYRGGAMYLMAGPMLFTNYNMLQPDGADYVSKALSYLPVKSEVIWDEFSALGPNDNGESPLRVIFNHKALRWAYFIAFFSLIVFVLYEIKRRQRIIPKIEPLQNASAEFVKTVGQVYYQKRDNANIVKKKSAYFLEDIRSIYNIKNQVNNEAFGELLAAKSGVKIEFVTQLMAQIMKAQNSKKVSDQELIALNKNMEQFYHQSK